MPSKKRISIRKSQRVKRNKNERNKKPVIKKDDNREYINKWDKEQQEWARTFNHNKENKE
tara:strand:- start:269 stop:448 length:180 start_codon:yes stop_codon:yes gene_type:complete